MKEAAGEANMTVITIVLPVLENDLMEDIDITETEITLPPESIVTESTEVTEETTLPTESVTEEIPPVTEEVIIPEEKKEELI